MRRSARAAPGLRPRRGSQPRPCRTTGHVRAAAPGLRPRRGSQHQAGAQADARGRQRRGFGPGEDHNMHSGSSPPAAPAAPGLRPWRGSQPRTGSRQPAWRLQRRGFGPGEDHNILGGSAARRWPRAAPGLRPWRGSQHASGRSASRMAVAAPGLRPWRGSQHLDVRACATGQAQRRGFGPGEDHNIAWLRVPRRAERGQRRGFGPGEDHNIMPAAGLPTPRQRRDFGPGEDHNRHRRAGPAMSSGSAGASALARITTPDHRRYAAARMLAAASVLLAG